MAYSMINFKTKEAFVEAVKAAGPEEDTGPLVRVHQPGPFGPEVNDGRITIEGPHFPKAHTWYAAVEVRNGYVVRIIS